MQELEKALITCAEDLEAVYLFVDVVNESERTMDILQSTSSIATASGNVFIIITSTPDSKLREDASGLKLRVVDMHPMVLESDIASYTDSRLATSPVLRVLNLELKADVWKKLLEQSDGM